MSENKGKPSGQGQPAGQGQQGEEYGVYGRGATKGGRYADRGDSVEENAPQRNVAQQDTARKEGQENVEEHARAQNANTDAAVGAEMHDNRDRISGGQEGTQDKPQQEGGRGANTLDALNFQATAMSEDAGGPQGARQINTAMEEVGRGLGDDRFLEGQSAQDSARQDHETWTAPRESTWKQNSGQESDFGKQEESPSVDVSKAPTDSSARTGVASEDF